MLHIYPLNDLKPHDMNTTCECTPKVLYDYAELICVHNAYDGREGVELANEILNKTTRHDGNE